MKIGFVSLGCPKNLVDSEVMMGLSQRGGHTLTPNPEEAEVLVVNTCAFIDSAKEESINTILELAGLKRHGSCQRLVVTGCLGERYREELKAQIPEIDAVLGTGDVPEIVGAIEGQPNARRIPLTLVRDLPTYLYDADSPRVFATPRHFAYIKVAEGCDYKCSFCIIPKLRGHYRSRPIDAIAREAQSLAERGVREVILISQDTTFYGRDFNQGAAAAGAAAQARRNRSPRLDSASLSVSNNHYRGDSRRNGRVREGLQVHRPSPPARGRRGASTNEASGHQSRLRKAAAQDSPAGPRRVAENDLHRGIPG